MKGIIGVDAWIMNKQPGSKWEFPTLCSLHPSWQLIRNIIQHYASAFFLKLVIDCSNCHQQHDADMDEFYHFQVMPQDWCGECN